MARVLILGGAGFIGYHLADRLSQEGGAVTLVDDLSRGRVDRDLETLLARPGVTLVRADLTAPDALGGLTCEWDQVYMLAAVVGVRNVEGDPARVIRVNTLATLNVLEWLRPSAGVLFFASTSETYAGVSPRDGCRCRRPRTSRSRWPTSPTRASPTRRARSWARRR